MPRLVLYDDNGNTLFDAPVSQSNVETIARFLRRNMGTLRAAATFKRAIEGLAQVGDVLQILAPSPRPRVKGRRS